MEENKNKFDEKIKTALESLPETIPSDAETQSLEKELMKEGIIKKRKRGFFLLFLFITLPALSALYLYSIRNQGDTVTSLKEEISRPNEIAVEKIQASESPIEKKQDSKLM